MELYGWWVAAGMLGVTGWLGEQMIGCVRGLTVDVLHYVGCESVTGECHEHLCRTLPPWHVVGRAPGCDGREQQGEVVLPR
jgi:hypothetical protein